MAVTDEPGISLQELELASRNHAMPLEALRYDVTPVGLHYVLVHYDIPHVDPARWRLAIDGEVEQPAELSLDDLRARPPRSVDITLECAGTGRARLTPRAVSQPWLHGAVGSATWTGVPLRDLLAEVGVRPDAVELVFTGADRGIEGGVEQQYQRSLPLAEATADDVLLAYDMNGAPLSPQHGFPVRLLVPGWYGMTHVKWLESITAVAEPFTGFQQVQAYRFRQHEDDPGEPVTRIAVRSLVSPVGVPEFLSRVRCLGPGPVEVTGRAWSGDGPITDVAFSADGGRTWAPATVDPARGPHAWHRWSTSWLAEPGEHVLCSRATDAAGNTQPLDPPWNLGGYAVNDVHRVRVQVSPPGQASVT